MKTGWVRRPCLGLPTFQLPWPSVQAAPQAPAQNTHSWKCSAWEHPLWAHLTDFETHSLHHPHHLAQPLILAHWPWQTAPRRHLRDTPVFSQPGPDLTLLLQGPISIPLPFHRLPMPCPGWWQVAIQWHFAPETWGQYRAQSTLQNSWASCTRQTASVLRGKALGLLGEWGVGLQKWAFLLHVTSKLPWY